MAEQQLQQCVYCGTIDDLTAEHAPAKLVFPEPRPNDLITVRACRKCNEAGSKDAEYFRLTLCLNPLVRNLPSVTALKPTVRRSFERPQAAGFLKSVIGAITPVCKDGAIMKVEMGRIHSVINRTARCIYLHETGQRLPDNYAVSTASVEVFRTMGAVAIADFKATFLDTMLQQPLRESAGGQFSYRLYQVGIGHTSVLSMSFYCKLPFVSFIAPKLERPRAAATPRPHDPGQGTRAKKPRKSERAARGS